MTIRKEKMEFEIKKSRNENMTIMKIWLLKRKYEYKKRKNGTWN